MNPFLAAAGLLAVMTAAVVMTMVAENWRRLVVPIPRRDEGLVTDELATAELAQAEPASAQLAAESNTAVAATGTERVPTVESSATAAPTDATATSTAGTTAPTGTSGTTTALGPIGSTGAVAHVAPSGSPDGALDADATTVRLRDQDTADVLAALLFAGLAATRRSGADRAAAWVTASATPPTADPARFAPGVRLRGRSAKVAELLEHRDGGCTWVTLQRDVDIARGLARTPVTQPTLAGLVTWWQATRDMPAALTPVAAGEVASAIEAIRPQLDSTAWSRVVGPLHDTLSDAADADRSVLVCLAEPAGGGAPSATGNSAAGHADEAPAAGPAAVSGDPRRAARTS